MANFEFLDGAENLPFGLPDSILRILKSRVLLNGQEFTFKDLDFEGSEDRICINGTSEWDTNDSHKNAVVALAMNNVVGVARVMEANQLLEYFGDEVASEIAAMFNWPDWPENNT